ncbi:unnamed protein product [Schistosoma margrebowiei]|uniref:Uncharacterized protein n=1 Tax=Schistosoma margrebowiei TaxID=48269 RepID=A0A183MI52_9TREM|nr:unnamed protein product [Schistosoma margrebowiei]
MMVGGSQQETLNPGFVLLMFPDGFDLVSPSSTVRDVTTELSVPLLGTRQQGVPVILRELMFPDGFDPVSPSFTVRDVTTDLSGPRLTSCMTEM